jgi:hypothetical protein
MVELLLLIIQQLYHFTITVPTTNIENPVFNENLKRTFSSNDRLCR